MGSLIYYYIYDKATKAFFEASLHLSLQLSCAAKFILHTCRMPFAYTKRCLTTVGKEIESLFVFSTEHLLPAFLFCGNSCHFFFYFLNFAKKRCSGERRFFAFQGKIFLFEEKNLLTSVLNRTIITGYTFLRRNEK